MALTELQVALEVDQNKEVDLVMLHCLVVLFWLNSAPIAHRRRVLFLQPAGTHKVSCNADWTRLRT